MSSRAAARQTIGLFITRDEAQNIEDAKTTTIILSPAFAASVYTLCLKNVHFCFCQKVVIFPPILIIFGR